MATRVMVRGAEELARSLRGAGLNGEAVVRGIVRDAGAMLLTQVQRNASGRPGPRVITGAYRRSWNLQVTGLTATVGTAAPQGRRLEYGFHGVDALGRRYDQPPFPHVRPAVQAVDAQLPAIASAAVSRMVNGL